MMRHACRAGVLLVVGGLLAHPEDFGRYSQFVSILETKLSACLNGQFEHKFSSCSVTRYDR